jgi:hypothetical protein
MTRMWACMVGAPGDLGMLRFSTDELPERERLLMFQEIFGRAITKVDFEPVAGTHLRVRATVRAIPGLGAWIGAFSPLHGRRTHDRGRQRRCRSVHVPGGRKHYLTTRSRIDPSGW